MKSNAWKKYEDIKRQIQALGLTSEQFEAVLRLIAEALKL